MALETLTSELEQSVDQALNGGNRSSLVGGMRPASAKYATQPIAPLADMLATVTQHNENLKAHLDQAIRDLQELRAKL